MRSLPRAIRQAPLFIQVLVLLLVGLVAAQLLTAAIIVSLPPPTPEVYRMADVAEALKGGPLPERLARSTAAAPPQGQAAGGPRGRMFSRRAGRELAGLIGVDPSRVRIVYRRPTGLLFDPVIRFDRPRPPPEAELPPAGPARGPMVGSGPAGARMMREPILVGQFRASLHQPDGTWVTVQPRRGAPFSLWQQRMLIWLVASAILFSPLAYLYARRLTSPITAFARAAERLGRNHRAPALALDGPAEVRTAVSAFNEMQERLRRYVDDRTAMMGAVAHDLRTPLTRMRFLLEARPEDVREKMEREIDEMDAMIAATLAFVKDASAAGERVRLDLGALVESLASDMAESGMAIDCEPCPRILVQGDPLALRRLFANLFTNADKFAGGAEVAARVEGREAVVTVADRGPGLPAAELDRAFEPFFRSESSRSRETGGIGLGLAVVRSVARAHGGDAVMSPRPGGGLLCTVRLPLEDEGGASA